MIARTRSTASVIARAVTEEAALRVDEAMVAAHIRTDEGEAYFTVLWGMASALEAQAEVFSKKLGHTINPVEVLKASMEMSNKYRKAN